jgi:Ferritin-like domain
LALNQEYIELDLFRFGLAMFSKEDFEKQGITEDYQFLIEYMAEQEAGHATLLSNILGREFVLNLPFPSFFHAEIDLSFTVFVDASAKAAKECKYTYPFKTVPEFIDFCQKASTPFSFCLSQTSHTKHVLATLF